jgi:hypothetical protein
LDVILEAPHFYSLLHIAGCGQRAFNESDAVLLRLSLKHKSISCATLSPQPDLLPSNEFPEQSAPRIG